MKCYVSSQAQTDELDDAIVGSTGDEIADQVRREGYRDQFDGACNAVAG